MRRWMVTWLAIDCQALGPRQALVLALGLQIVKVEEQLHQAAGQAHPLQWVTVRAPETLKGPETERVQSLLQLALVPCWAACQGPARERAPRQELLAAWLVLEPSWELGRALHLGCVRRLGPEFQGFAQVGGLGLVHVAPAAKQPRTERAGGSWRWGWEPGRCVS